MSITAIVLTKNEEARIEECLKSLKWADELIVLDSDSRDQTKQIATQVGAKVFEKKFVDFSDQRNHAMSQASGQWILFIDADERVSSELAIEIQSVIESELTAYAIPRHNYFFGKRLRYSGSAEDAPVRLFPRGSGVWKQPVHEYFETSLPIKKLKENLVHHTTRDLPQYMEKVGRYVPLEVETMVMNGRRAGWSDVVLRPPAKFFYLYFVRGGVCDGWTGFQYAILSSYYDFKKYSLFVRQIRSQKG